MLARATLLIVWLIICPAVGAAAEDTPPGIRSIAKLQWPGEVDREAYVILSFTVGVDGKATDIETVLGGFYQERFVKAARNVVSRATFEPATRNGVPAAVRAQMPFRFKVTDKPGVTPEFAAEIAKVVALAKKNDFAGAHFHAQWMLSEKVRLNYEFAALEATLAQTYANVGEDHSALRVVREATRRSGQDMEEYQPGGRIPPNSIERYALPAPLTASLLGLQFRLAGRNGLYLDALRAYAQLKGLNALPDGDPINDAAGQIIAAVQSGQTLIGKVKLDEDATWEHRPWRRTFTLTEVAGTVRQIHLRCADATRLLPYQPDVEWTLPAQWKDCSIGIDGAPGTTFKIVEFSDKPAISAAPAAP
jgi:TonB family protein